MKIRRQKYKRNRIKGMNQYNAARAAGYSESYSRTHSDKIEKAIKSDICDAFEQAGVTDKAIVKHAIEGLKADKVISCNVYIKHEDNAPDEEMKEATGTTKDFIDVPDWGNRHKYFNTICEMTSRIKHKIEHTRLPGQGETKIIIVSDKNGSKNRFKTIPDTISL